MSMHQGIDLSRFRKISSDGKTTTLRHSKGHEVKIAHGALSPKMRDTINQMPAFMKDGEDVPSPIPAPSDLPVSDESSVPAEEPQPAAQMPDTQPPVEQTNARPPEIQNVSQNQDSQNKDSLPREPQQPQEKEYVPQPINPTEMKLEDVNFNQDVMNNHIKPETYHDLYAKKDTLGKIGTLFGLLVGGAGAGLTHQPNALMEMMNREITNDLESQKANVANKQNFLRLNLDHQMNIAQISRLQKEGKLTEAQAKAVTADANTKAYTLAQMQMNRAALHSLVQKVNKMPMGSPQRADAEKQLAFLSQGIQNENFNLADRAGASSALANVAFTPGSGGSESDFQNRQNTLRMSGNPAMSSMAESNEQKHFPGIEGQASVPLNQQEREQILAGTQFQNEMKRFIDWTKAHSGDLNPKDRAEGQAMAGQLQGAYRQATHGGVYKEGEQGFISHIIDSDPTKFFNYIRVIPKLSAVQRESAAQLNDLVKSKGFKGFKGPAAEKTSEKQYKIVNGIKYERGPNGEAIKVK